MAARPTKKRRAKKATVKKNTPKKASKKRATGRRPPREKAPDKLFAQVSPRSLGGRSLFDYGQLVSSNEVDQFTSETHVIHGAIGDLRAAGFDVLSVGDCTISIAGPPDLYEDVFGAKLFSVERPAFRRGKETTTTCWDSGTSDLPGHIDTSASKLANTVEGIAIEHPVQYHAEDAFPPRKSYWYLDVPGDVSLGANADRAHRLGYTGRNVHVTMADSGWYRHPYFTQRGYRSAPVVLGPGASNPNDDEIGHGTGESANAFATAPDIDFTMIKLNLANATGGFNAAAALDPDIISCSWGSQARTTLTAGQQALAAAIAAAVARGIIVVFSAGNGPSFGFPGQHPDVISAGGVFLHADGTMEASDYTTGFASQVYPGRNVPDLSGLVGMMPIAAYIMLPLQAGDAIDVGNSGGTHPNKDETARDDGWAAFSGTSAAAPQIAGVCALIKQACPRLTPAEVKNVLNSSARDVTQGTNAMGNNAAAGYDLATGFGLVNAHRAVLLARLRCRIRPTRPVRGPIQPIRGPIQPIRGPIQPIRGPIQPIRGPIQPIRGPIQPIRGPIQPIRGPIQPIRGPIRPGPIRPGPFADPEAQAAAAQEEEYADYYDDELTEEEQLLAEQMLLDSDDSFEF